MAIKFQYNKTSLQLLNKQLKVRVRALPTIKSKESALRMEVKKTRAELRDMEDGMNREIASYELMFALWSEFNAELITIKDVEIESRKIAGVKIPILKNIDFDVKPFSLFNNPKWFYDGIELLKRMAKLGIEIEFCSAKLNLLEYNRKKTTQKVNLFEKVQIPGYNDAILKIKRFMEDEENLSKSSQKIIKSRHENINMKGA